MAKALFVGGFEQARAEPLWTSMAAPIISCVISLSVTYSAKGTLTQRHTEEREEKGGECCSAQLGDRDFFIGAEDVAQGVADFPERGVGFHGVVDVGHQIFRSLRGFAQSGEPARDFVVGAFGAEFSQAFGLAMRAPIRRFAGFPGAFPRPKFVHADDDFFLAVDRHLVAVRGVGDFALRVSPVRWQQPCRPSRQSCGYISRRRVRFRW